MKAWSGEEFQPYLDIEKFIMVAHQHIRENLADLTEFLSKLNAEFENYDNEVDEDLKNVFFRELKGADGISV